MTHTSVLARVIIAALRGVVILLLAVSGVVLGVGKAHAGEKSSFTDTGSVFFSTNSTLVNTTSQDGVLRIARDVKAHHETQVIVMGFASSTGSVAGNLILSAARASSVGRYLRHDLVLLKVSGVQVVCVGRGATAFLGPNSAAANNRRVDLIATS